MSPEQELASLKVKLASRKGRFGFEENVREIKKRIKELEMRDG